ncbi:MAG: hypothetical protein H6634_10815 [Anaerolineales bacterium]|nr:hypothetical protein [Anaerolineales bacterium]
MKTLRVIYHLARADFLERVRRYSFLIMLGLVVWLGYLSASGQMRMRVPPDYTGVINSAWVGATMTVTVSLLLGWVGFYIVKGSVSRDYETGVGQIMATTPLSRPLYMLGKWLSNFAVLGIAVVIMMIEGILMNLLLGTHDLDLLALAVPLVVIALPCVALIAALAVLFESIGWLRGGLGNVIYFFAFMFALVWSGQIEDIGTPGKIANPYIDFTGWQIIGDSVSHAARAVYPDTAGGFAFSITDLAAPNIFLWNGLQWTRDILLSRGFFLLVAMGIVLTSSLFFDRFNPSRLTVKRKKADSDSPALTPAIEATPRPDIHLTPLPASRPRFRFDALYLAELKLLLRGQRWWWYVVAAGLVIAQLANTPDVTRILLVVAWVWPILLLSGLGSRESRHNTREMVFSAPRPVLTQLPATWLAAFTLMALTGSGALVKFLTLGDTHSILAWLVGAIFVPSLALAFGVLTGSSKTFEIVYVFWMYLILNKFAAIDFVGLTPNSPWLMYLGLSLVLMIVAVSIRQWQIKTR